MIGYLKGNLVEIDRRTNNRILITLDVNQVGYEIQVTNRLTQGINEQNTALQVFTHVQTKEEQTVLFGFPSKAERDLFRLLMSVSGVGAQSAIALLDTLEINDLVQAIVSGNIRLLTKAPGVGNKIAERIALELKTKMKQWRIALNLSEVASPVVASAIQEDVEITLLALGYSNLEIAEALQALSQDPQLTGNTQPEEWIKRAIAWLSL